MVETVGHYALIESIGAGAIGVLYRARDTKTGRTVALRIIDPVITSDPARCAELEQALQRASTISHPGIAVLYEAGQDGANRFYTQEFVPGLPLQRVIDDGPLNARRALGLAIEMADALAEAEAIGLAHEHLSPSFVMVTPKGRAKLLDMGFAGWTRAGAAAADADMPALGRLLREAIAGRRTPPLVVPAQLDAVVQRAIDGHYDSAALFAAALRGVDEELDTRVAAPPAVRPVDRSRSALRWLIAAGAVMLVAAAAALIWYATETP